MYNFLGVNVIGSSVLALLFEKKGQLWWIMLLLHEGNFVGINTMKMMGTMESNMQIPSLHLLRVLPELLNNTQI